MGQERERRSSTELLFIATQSYFVHSVHGLNKKNTNRRLKLIAEDWRIKIIQTIEDHASTYGFTILL